MRLQSLHHVQCRKDFTDFLGEVGVFSGIFFGGRSFAAATALQKLVGQRGDGIVLGTGNVWIHQNSLERVIRDQITTMPLCPSHIHLL